VNPGLLAVNLKSRVAPTNGESHFSIKNTDPENPIVAAGFTRFFEKDFENPIIMENTIREHIKQWIGYPRTAPFIHCDNNHFRLSKDKFHWKSPADNDVVDILKRLSIEFGVKIIVKYSRGRSMEGFFNLKTITW
jgi:hypothetical protein